MTETFLRRFVSVQHDGLVLNYLLLASGFSSAEIKKHSKISVQILNTPWIPTNWLEEESATTLTALFTATSQDQKVTGAPSFRAAPLLLERRNQAWPFGQWKTQDTGEQRKNVP